MNKYLFQKSGLVIGLSLAIILVFGSFTNIAFAYGGGGGGAPSYPGMPGTSGMAIIDDAVTILRNAVASPMFELKLLTTSELAAEKAEITTQINNITRAISSLTNAGVIANYKNLAISAVKQTLLRLIRHTINVVTNRIAVLAAQ